ncbi:MAG: hypothetical protein ACLUKN_06935 [Bacilli bacterium]
MATLQIDSKLYYLFSDTSMFERARSIDVSKWLVFIAKMGISRTSFLRQDKIGGSKPRVKRGWTGDMPKEF